MQAKLRAHWLIGSLVLVLLVIGTTGCSSSVGGVTIGKTLEYSQPVSGQTPGTLAKACQAGGGTVQEGTNAAGGAQTTCTMPNGDANTCDWQEQRCRTICLQSSDEACAALRDLAWVPPWKLKATPAPPTR